jgi:hypothetical protein
MMLVALTMAGEAMKQVRPVMSPRREMFMSMVLLKVSISSTLSDGEL